MRSMAVGGGGRFAAMKGKMARKGLRNPAGATAAIGRKKYVAPKMRAMAAKGRSRAMKASYYD